MIIRGMLQVGFESLARLGRVGIQHGGQTWDSGTCAPPENAGIAGYYGY